VKKAIALGLFYIKGDFYLGEFIDSLKNALELINSIEGMSIT
jgi:hypothetical protein